MEDTMDSAAMLVENSLGGPEQLIACNFFIPMVRNSDRQPHRPLIWREFEDLLKDNFDGHSGPDGLWHIYRSDKPIPGTYKNKKGERVDDLCSLYKIALPIKDVSKLRNILKEARSLFDQECIYLEIVPYVEFI